MEIRKGDTIHMLATVIDVSPNFTSLPVHVSIGDGSRTFWIAERDIVAVTPRPIAVGDHVRSVSKEGTSAHMQRMEVVGIKGNLAWCQSGGYDYVLDVSELERVP